MKNLVSLFLTSIVITGWISVKKFFTGIQVQPWSEQFLSALFLAFFLQRLNFYIRQLCLLREFFLTLILLCILLWGDNLYQQTWNSIFKEAFWLFLTLLSARSIIIYRERGSNEESYIAR